MTPPTYPIFNLAICIVLIFVYVTPFYLKKGLAYRQYADNRLNFWFFLLICGVFCTFAFSNGDYINYHGGYVQMMRAGNSSHFEDIYVWLAMNFAKTYHLWRAIIWGLATYLTLLSFKRLSIPAMPAYAAITVFYLTTLYIMRGNLGVGFMVYGLSFLFQPISDRSKQFSILLGIFLIGISYFFHKSMLISIGLLFPALITMNRKRLSISFWLFPVAIIATRFLLEYMQANGLGEDDTQMSSYAKHYAETKQFVANTNGLIAYFFQYGAPYCFLIYVFKKNITSLMPPRIAFFFNYWYWWVYMASACAFQEIGGWYYSRFMYMSNLPLAIVMGYIYYKMPSTRWIKIITIWGVLGFLYPVLYSVYKS